MIHIHVQCTLLFIFAVCTAWCVYKYKFNFADKNIDYITYISPLI
jgi:hypothetical protein